MAASPSVSASAFYDEYRRGYNPNYHNGRGPFTDINVSAQDTFREMTRESIREIMDFLDIKLNKYGKLLSSETACIMEELEAIKAELGGVREENEELREMIKKLMG